MRKDQKWSGLVTHASPYLLPRGANQEQTNVHCRKPGELQCRRGVSRLSASGPAVGTVLDAWSIRGSQGSRLLSLTQSGNLVLLESLEAVADRSSYVPALSTQAGQTATSYTWEYQVDGGRTNNLVFVFYGGAADQATWDYTLVPRIACDNIDSVQAGNAVITDTQGISSDYLCNYDSP